MKLSVAGFEHTVIRPIRTLSPKRCSGVSNIQTGASRNEPGQTEHCDGDQRNHKQSLGIRAHSKGHVDSIEDHQRANRDSLPALDTDTVTPKCIALADGCVVDFHDGISSRIGSDQALRPSICLGLVSVTSFGVLRETIQSRNDRDRTYRMFPVVLASIPTVKSHPLKLSPCISTI